MILASWHSVHAVRTLAWTGPAGKSGDCERATEDAPSKRKSEAVPVLRLNMNFHPVDGVVKISARVPDCGFRLSASLVISGA
jgi:hypothetical protein